RCTARSTACTSGTRIRRSSCRSRSRAKRSARTAARCIAWSATSPGDGLGRAAAMIVVTGGAGFIGSNVVGALNSRGRSDVVVVDDMTDGRKFVNLVGRDVADYFDKNDFLGRLKSRAFGKIDAIFHQGACAVTTEWNGRYVLETNYRYSVE